MAKKNEEGAEIPEVSTEAERKQPVQWANEKQLGINLASRTAFAIATLVKRWPNPGMEPDFTVTETEFDAAILAAGKM